MQGDLQPLVDAIRGAVRDGKTAEVAARDLSLYVSEDRLAEALGMYFRQAESIRRLKIPGGFVDDADPGWYQGPQPSDLFWPAMRESLLSRLPDTAVEAIDGASSKIVAYLPNPSLREFDARGLVVGYVQSGKTANYSAVIAKAADAGYKLVIVLSGIHEALRIQTQRRLDREIVNLSSETQRMWHPLTSDEADFRIGSFKQPDAILSGANNPRVLAVVKKNGPRLKKLITWSQRASLEVLRSCPLLLIDDEADQASVNTSGDSDPSIINERIRLLLRTFPRSAYVGYTATPFANVLIGMRNDEDDDLYPRDFIFDLPRPVGYFGAEKLFGRERLPLDDAAAEHPGLDVIRSVPDSEIPRLQPSSASTRGTFAPEIVPSLRTAIRYFWLAAAARRARGDLTSHSSMLVHTTMYVDIQNRLAPLIDRLRLDDLAALRRVDDALLRDYAALWVSEAARVPHVVDPPTTFAEVQTHLSQILEGCEVIVENAQSVRRLSYGESGSIYIVVGGNVLSRGLTLEGLIVSFFVRAAGAYDTLLQMGRWFGYREGYEDLPRIWLTQELQGHFADLALVEQEVRYDIARYESEGLTPRQFGPRIRSHPTLSITSPMKMRRAIDAEVSFGGQLVQTILFHHRDIGILNNNLRAVEDLVRGVTADGHEFDQVGASMVCRGVDVRRIKDFIAGYSWHEGARTLAPDTLNGYIRAQNAGSDLLTWSVAIIGRRVGRRRAFSNLVSVGALRRSRLRASDDHTARLGVIASSSDLVIDLADRAPIDGPNALDAILDRRGSNPLLLIYPVDRTSQPSEPGSREPLDAVEDLIGIAIVFPRSRRNTPQQYKAAFLPEAYVEIPEEEVDAEDEPLEAT